MKYTIKKKYKICSRYMKYTIKRNIKYVVDIRNIQ